MLNDLHRQVHARALELSHNYRLAEWQLIAVLDLVERAKIYKKLDKRSLFSYAVETLGLAESVAYSFISVCRKVREVPALARASEKLSAFKASRIVAALNPQNADELIQFAIDHTTREIDLKVAGLNPKAAPRDRVKVINEDCFQITMTVDKQTYQNFQRAQAIQAQKGKVGKMGATLEAVLDVFLDAHDPVRKAERSRTKLCANRVYSTIRTPLSAAEKHTVMARDQGRCTHVTAAGKRCNSDRWVHIHHIRPVHLGGSNDPENLTVLCSFHHDVVHRGSGVRESKVEYRVAR